MAPSKKIQFPISLQERDIAFLRGLFESRVMTAAHVTKIYFSGKGEAAKKRLQKLKAAKLIGERPRRAFEPAVLFLTREGLGPLREQGILEEYPAFDLPALERRARVSALTLRHELQVMDIKATFAAAMTPPFSMAEFNTWPLLNEFTAVAASDGTEALVRPDGFIRVHEKEMDGGVSEHAFFLEVDRSTETQEALVSRAFCYLNYYRSGAFAERQGGDRTAFKEYPFRVLMVFKTAERRNNTAERLLEGHPPILTQVWLTTFPEIVNDPFGKIWIQPLDYRSVIQNTPFSRIARTPAYQRQNARDILVEERIEKRALLTSS